MTIKVNATTLRKDFARVQAAISSAPRHLRSAVESKATIALATNVFVRPLREATPKRTGKLRRSIRARIRRDGDGIDIRYGRRTKERARSTFYSLFLEFGYTQVTWGHRTGRRNLKHRHKARDSVYGNRREFVRKIESLLNKKVAHEVNRRIGHGQRGF